MEKPVFILGSHKSGTTLLRNLLDGAPDLFVVPIETHLFQYTGHWINYALRSNLPSSLTFDEVVENLNTHLRKSNSNTNRTADSLLTNKWDIDQFNKWFKENGEKHFESKDFKSLNDCYIEAIHLSLFGDLPHSNRFAEKSVENAEYASIINRIYPDANFLHIIRNPYATIVSIRKHVSLHQKHYPYLDKLMSAINNSYYYLYKNPLQISNYKIIRYEDLVTNPSDVIREIAKFIEIDFSEVLLEPTVMGTKWSGNSTSGRPLVGISRDRIDAWKGEIYPLEIMLINTQFGHIFRDYSYAYYDTKRSLMLPAKERPQVYLANRLLLLIARHQRYNETL
jgi:protein-tyrosine sulfotransferase